MVGKDHKSARSLDLSRVLQGLYWRFQKNLFSRHMVTVPRCHFPMYLFEIDGNVETIDLMYNNSLIVRKHVLYKFMRYKNDHLAKDSNVVFMLDAAGVYRPRPAPYGMTALA